MVGLCGTTGTPTAVLFLDVIRKLTNTLHTYLGHRRWFYHYTGAIITDKFLRDGTGKLLWDGVTGQTIDNFEDLIQEIQRFQQLPRVNEASFHVEHAILWHFLASVMPNVTEYPSDVANTLCRWDSHVREHGIKGRGVGKGLTHECYHGFGHAAFYVVAKRQAARSTLKVADPNALVASLASFSDTNFRSTDALVTQATLLDDKRKAAKAPSSDATKSMLTDRPPLISKVENGGISVSTKNAIEIAKTTAETSSARVQFRPNIGFELTPESFCEVYHLCKGAAHKSDAYFDDEEPKYPFSHGIRVCLEGVVHSVRLFSTDRHNKKDAITYVNKHMQRCQNDEISDQQRENSQSASSALSNRLDVKEGRAGGNRTNTSAATEMPELPQINATTLASNASSVVPETIVEETPAKQVAGGNTSALMKVVEATTANAT